MAGKLSAPSLIAKTGAPVEEVERKKKRLQTFCNKILTGSPFTLVKGGSTVVLDSNNKAINDQLGKLLDGRLSSDALSKMVFKDKNGYSYKLVDFEKTPEFGGKPKGEGAGERAERQAHAALVKQLGQIMEETGEDYVNVLIPGLNGDKPYKITHAVWTDEYLASSTEKKTKPKSDVELWYENTPVVFISYKDNYGRRLKKNGTYTVGYADPRGFQQFGGMSEGGSPQINAFPEVQSFIKYFKIMAQENSRKARWLDSTYVAKIQDEKLKKMSVYGLGWQGGKGFSRQNCNVVLQGRVSFTEVSTDIYELDADHVQINSARSDDGMNDDYEPVLFVRWNPSRGTGDPPNVRFMIMPEKGCGTYKLLTKKQIDDKIAAHEALQKQKSKLQSKIKK
jgi:hypothetical protein